MGRVTFRAFRRLFFPIVLLMLILSASVVMLPGCSGIADLAMARDSAVRVRSGLTAGIREAEGLLSTLPEVDVRREALIRDIEEGRVSLDAVDAAIRQIDLVVSEAVSPTDSLTIGLRAIQEALPEPLRAPLLLGVALLVTIIRAGRLKAALVSVVKSIEKAKQTDESFQERFRAHAPTFRSVQTPTARRIVDETTKDTLILRFPV